MMRKLTFCILEALVVVAQPKSTTSCILYISIWISCFFLRGFGSLILHYRIDDREKQVSDD